MMAKGSKCRWGNVVAVILFPLWIKSEDDPLEYIRRAKTMMDRKKISLEAFILYGIIKLALKFFGGKVKHNTVINYLINISLWILLICSLEENNRYYKLLEIGCLVTQQ